MRCITQVIKRTSLRQKILFTLIGCYLLFFTSAIMITPTISYFMSTSSIEGQIETNHSFIDEENEEKAKDSNDEKRTAEKRQQDQDKE